MSVLRPFDLVMFDLDGTLVDSAPEIADAVCDTLHRLALPTVTLEQVIGWVGRGTRELLVEVLAYLTHFPPERVRTSALLAVVVTEFRWYYRNRCGTHCVLFPHVRETLDALRQQGTRLALVTNKDAHFTHVVLERLGLMPSFDLVISGDTLPQRKPDPSGVQLCLDRFGVQRERALFVGDSAVDVATARNAGVPIWAVPYGYNAGRPVVEDKPDRLIFNCSALLDL
ncbi:phosphoglycolate phosphatase [Candidatus Symbiobacter mobilis]|uniref:phosphoglycolate phosphatase n=1 Tax=Candidatus Symbiobacter mobilis CR TaxID=946483 RepID=U5NA74_9BURK|nr:phosphoglycolate phosphatase [Candidatus Symbiobacter mobilis]AGX88220.1 phosphoglycolate phosphatase [Candidatus Symbiobacter mobilis CR]